MLCLWSKKVKSVFGAVSHIRRTSTALWRHVDVSCFLFFWTQLAVEERLGRMYFGSVCRRRALRGFALRASASTADKLQQNCAAVFSNKQRKWEKKKRSAVTRSSLPPRPPVKIACRTQATQSELRERSLLHTQATWPALRQQHGDVGAARLHWACSVASAAFRDNTNSLHGSLARRVTSN